MFIFFGMKISIGKAAEELGVTKETLRRWERSGRIASERTPKGHRRYDLSKLLGITARKNPSEKRTIGYARVSSPDQKGDLLRQSSLLESYCSSQGWKYEIFQDLGSGINYNKISFYAADFSVIKIKSFIIFSVSSNCKSLIPNSSAWSL